VTHIGQRLSLYREIDDIEQVEDLNRFALSIADRFGPVPPATLALFETLKLRWLGKSMGMEKVVLKNEKMICFFVSNPESAFFQSEEFRDILRFVQQNPSSCSMVEKKDKLSLRFSPINNVHEALETMQSIMAKTVVNKG
jgi:transcription-repair coupling factor (superfamily II helicase)